jgi:hypothetical protein
MARGGEISKTKFCEEWGTNTRTLGRWIEKYLSQIQSHTEEDSNEIKVGDKVRVICSEAELRGFYVCDEIIPNGIYTVTNVEDLLDRFRLDNLLAGWVERHWVEKVGEDVETEEQQTTSPDDYQFIISQNSATVIKNGESAIVHRDSPNYKAVVDLLLTEDFENSWAMTSVKKAIEEFSQGKIKVTDDDKVFYGTFEVRNRMTDKLVEMIRDGAEGTKAFCAFFEAVMTDIESDYVREQLWPFIESQCIELNDDGTFTGYRAVRSDYLDKHTGTIDNSVGQVVVMPRHLVNSDPNQACSAGLHVGSLEYAKGFKGGNDRLIKVKCHVRDVVSVPYDYDAGKLRCCRFEVIEDITDSI